MDSDDFLTGLLILVAGILVGVLVASIIQGYDSVDGEFMIGGHRFVRVVAELDEDVVCEPFVEDEVFVEYMGECVKACMSGTVYVTVERYNECEEHCFPKRRRC